MGRIYDAMTEWFKTEDWTFQEHATETVLMMGFEGQHATWQCYAQAREKEGQFVFYVVAPVKVSEAQRLEAAEFLTRANFGLVLGNFELDFSDGEIRYKTSVDCDDVPVLAGCFRPCVYAAVLTADRYFPGLTAVLFGGSTPEQGVTMVESQPA